LRFPSPALFFQALHAIVLSAGFGQRLGGKQKAFLRVGNASALNLAVEASNQVSNVTCIHVVHNARDAEKFRAWLSTLRTNHNSRMPYVRLRSDGSRKLEDRLGAVGSLWEALRKFKSFRENILISCVDTFASYGLAEFVCGQGDAKVALASPGTVRNPCAYGQVSIDQEGRVVEFWEKPEKPIGEVWLGPLLLGPKAQKFVGRYVQRQRLLGRLPDNLGDLVGSMVSEGLNVHGWFPTKGRAYDLSVESDRGLAAAWLKSNPEMNAA
jgi:NDP-sugar pyrophosphorylase family protein